MARAAAAPERTPGLQRGRGGFLRTAGDVPYVTDPSGASVKSGERKGQPKRIAYGSPSNRGKQIENTTNLVKWGERRVVLGIAQLIRDAQLARLGFDELIEHDVDSDDYKTLADSIIIKAKEAAEAHLAAERGTFTHALTEDSDGGHDWLARAEQGEDLGIDASVQGRLVAAWRKMLDDNGIEILAVEQSVVDDIWHLAGTLDRIGMTTKPLTFVKPGGELVVISARTVLVLDVKTGQRRLDDRDGSTMFWHGYAIQIASYAQSRPYDTDTETRGDWPYEISQEHALIAHLDVRAALEGGDVVCDLVYVDLVAGREHGGACVEAAKSWEQRRDVFSVAQLDVDGAGSGDEAPTEEQPAEVAPNTSAALTPADEQNAVRARHHGTPDEGGDATEAMATLEQHYTALSGGERACIAAFAAQATQAGVGFHAKAVKSVRRFEILRGLVLLAKADACTDDVVRALAALVVGDVAYFANVTPGHVLGTLDAAEAAAFARHADAFAEGRMTATVADDGTLSLRPAA